MHTESIEYQADGERRVGYLAVDRARGTKRPGILIAHEASGVSEVVKTRARKLAELGYVAFAMDYVGDGVVLQGLEKTAALLEKYRDAPERIRAVGRASLDVLRAQPECDATKLAAIGYCYGGAAVLELARDGADIACTVGFHAQLSTKHPTDAQKIRGKVLACIGADDPWVPAEQRLAFEQEMRAANVDWRLHVYGGAVHGFANPDADRLKNPALAYHRPSHERSWRAMIDLFEETFGPL
ncbi:dienelactone hydrolase family protein [Pendulispora brunnea]|uniref:Dienelactone hydrolase family protein n=1 Tax=Pendulispora brunnea TaxID=2905690 RepID=A0ABZ2JYH4_9BACT